VTSDEFILDKSKNTIFSLTIPLKNSKHILFSCTLFIFCFISSYAQSPQAKIIVDSKKKTPLEYVYITSDSISKGVMSDKNGKVVLQMKPGDRFSIYKMGFVKLTLSYSELIKSDTIALAERSIQLPDVQISVQKLEKIIVNKKFYVDDYVVLPNEDILFISTIKNNDGFKVSYFKREKGITFSKKILSENQEHFFTDCFNNFHLVTTERTRQIYFPADSTFAFLPPKRKAEFDTLLSKTAIVIDSVAIYKTSRAPSTYTMHFFSSQIYSPFLTYISIRNKKTENFYTVVYNKENREMIKTEFNDIARIQQAKKDIGAEPKSQASVEADHMLFFTQIVKPLYAPIYLKNDTVIIFDFQEDEIVFLNKDRIILNKVKLQEFSKYRHFECFYDKVKQRFYISTGTFDGRILNELNIYTGKFTRSTRIEYPFSTNLQILNGKLYYLVREKEWDDTSYLYQQNLN
jgi:hypothetical protein